MGGDVGDTLCVISNRNIPHGCTHKVNINDWPIDLRDSYSHDPYFHTAHMEPCQRAEAID